MRHKEEEGQTIIILAFAMSFFLIGVLGLAIDVSHLYSEQQMAQAAADAGAQAAIMDIFDGTATGANFSSSTPTFANFSCTTSDARTPCVYAAKNGFGTVSGDTVSVAFPADSAAPGVAFSSTDPTHLVQVTVTRSVKTTLMRLLGPTASTVGATGMAAITAVTSPTPLLITDPHNANTLTGNGGPTITICGGPSRSVQVNSSSATAYTGGVNVDLSHAGTGGAPDCSVAAGSDFGVFGGDSTDAATGSAVNLGSAGHYLSPASPIQDPLAGIAAPSNPGGSTPGTTSVPAGAAGNSGPPSYGCIASGGCVLYSPGYYTSLQPGNVNVLFKPGLYYVYGGGVDFKQNTGGGANNNAMCVGCTADTNTGTGMLIYDTGPADPSGFAQTGGFNSGTKPNVWIVGPTVTQTVNGHVVPGPPYYNVALWEDRTAEARSHTIGQGTGCFTVTGTIYITNTLAIMTNTADPAYPNHVQSVSYGGNPCSTTVTTGDIIVGQLNLSGNKAAITMNLQPYGFLTVRQVALVQ